MKDPLFLIVLKLLSKNKIAYDKKELSFQIKSHPSYPSLHAITGVLDHFNIENVAAEVPANKTTLEQLPDTFIAQITTEKGNELVTVSRDDLNYSIFSDSKKNEKITQDDFLKIFTGIIVAVEKDEHQKTKQNSTLKNVILFSTLILLVSITLFNKSVSLIDLSFIVLSILGIVASQSILKQELGENTVIGEALCSSNNEKKDCAAVLSSKGAEIIKNHKLSDLSILYFSGLLLSCLFVSDFTILYTVSILALPITLYSIYYQNNIVKSWCTLCLSIVGVLWLQGILAFSKTFSFNNIFTISINDIMLTSISFISTYIVWSFVKPLFKDTIELQKEKVEAIKFKRNFNLFETLLKKSSTINTKIQDSKEIILGNQEAPLEIVIITNPFCGHCKPVHQTVHKILERYSNTVKIIIRFNIPAENPENQGTIITTRLVELYNEKGEKECKKAMDDIYSGMSFEKWISVWNKASNFEKYSKTLLTEKEWCNQNAINFTPEILINGKSFPKEYKREDILFFIEDLEEHTVLVTQ